MYRWLVLAFVLAAIVAGLVIGVLNAQVVSLDLVVFSPTLPLGALVLASLALGVLLGIVLTYVLFVLPGHLMRRKRSQPASDDQRLTDKSNV